MILAGKPLCIMELVICGTVALSGPVLYFAALCWVLLHVQLGLQACAALISWVHDKLCQLIFTEEPASSSHLAPAITLPACPCLYLEEKQHVLMATSFGLTVEVTNGIVYS